MRTSTSKKAALEAVSILCSVLQFKGRFGSCAELAAAVSDELDEEEASAEVRKLIQDELGIGLRPAKGTTN